MMHALADMIALIVAAVAVRSAHSAVYMIAIEEVRKAERKNNRVHIMRTAVD